MPDEQDAEDIDSEGASVIRCLQDYINEVKDAKCKDQASGVGAKWTDGVNCV